MTVLAVLTVLAILETQWRAPCHRFAGPTNTGQRGNRDGCGGFGTYGGFGGDGYPLQLNPRFRHPENFGLLHSPDDLNFLQCVSFILRLFCVIW